ncbi:MAG TPA: ATP-binding protein [Verrucomicrobiae bacterium]
MKYTGHAPAGMSGSGVWTMLGPAHPQPARGPCGGLLGIRGTEFVVFTSGLPERFVLRVEPAGSNALWVAGYRTDSGYRGACRLRRYLPATGESTAVATVPGQVRRLVDTPEGVWIATEQPEMILFWDGKSRAPELRFKVPGFDPLALASANGDSPPPRLQSWRDPNPSGGGWTEIQFGTNGPAFHWLRRHGFLEAQINRLSGEASHPAWVAAGHSLAQPTEQSLTLMDFPGRPLPPEVEVMCANREGGIWLGTWEDGLHLVRERPLKVVSTAEGLADNDVRSVCRARRGGAWVATRSGPHHLLEGRAEQISVGQMRCVAEDSTGRLWWGIQDSGEASLRYLSPEGPQSFRLPGVEWRGPNTIHFARDGTMWVVCEAGVTWVKPEKLPEQPEPPAERREDSGFGRFRRGVELPESEPFGLVEDREGMIWVGSRDGGLYRIGKEGVAVVNRTNGFPGSLAVPALVDETGALWILSDTGIIRHRQGRFELIGPDHGVPRDLLIGMVEDDRGVFWIAGSRGIYRLARADLEAFLQERLARVPSLALGLRDGLLTPECSASACPNMAKLADGRIAVATHNGLAVIDPSRVELNTRPLSVLFEQVVAKRRALMIPPLAAGGRLPAVAIDSRQRWAGGVELPPGSGRQLEIHYTAVSLLAAERVQFRHRLEGQDAEWSDASDHRIAFYSNLRPGRYQFHAQASNAQGIWPEEDWILSLLIHPYFWETRIFQVAATLTIAVVLLLLHLQRVRTLRALQELKHKQQFDGERARIAADMHDDLGAALTQIAILGEVAKRQVSDSPQATSLLDRITQSARDVTSRMSDLVWATNPRHDSLDNLSAHLREQAARMLQDTPVRPLLSFPTTLPDAHLSATVRRNVLLVMKEAINNALRHARASEIHVSFVADAERFRLVVEDNGCGFDSTERREAGNGLNNMRRRIADLGGEYELISKPGAGTRVSLTVPFSGIGVPPREATESM